MLSYIKLGICPASPRIINMFSLLFLAATALAHIPFMDDGTHISYSSAFEYTDEDTARTLNINFDCPSLPVYTKVEMQNETTFILKYGMTNDTEILDYRPAVWVIGKTVSVPEEWENSTDGYDAVNVPVGFNSYRIDTTAEDLISIAEGEGLTFAILGKTSVNVTEPADVFLVVEPTEQRRSRFWLGVGKTELDVEDTDEDGQASDLTLEAFHEPETFPRLGWYCQSSKFAA